jgi:hypothetical protein
MSEYGSEAETKVWKKFLRAHWKATALTFAAIALAVIGAILVFLSFASAAQASGLVPISLGLWTIGNFISFLINLAFWEIVLVGIPMALAAIAWYLWWRTLPIDERNEYRRGDLFGKRSRRSDSGSGFSCVFFIAFAIKVYLDGNWNTAFSTWSFDYLVSSWLLAIVAVLAIVGIPMLIGGLWWLNREMRKNP